MPRTANPDKTTTNKRSKEALGATENDAVVQIPVVLPKEVRDDIAKIARNTPVEGSESEEKHTIFSFLESRYSLRNMILGDAEKFKAEAATFADTPSRTAKLPDSAEELDELMAKMQAKIAAIQAKKAELS